MGSGPQGVLTSESSIAGPVAMTTVDRARRPKERIKWKEIAGALRRKKEIKAGFSGIRGHLFDLHPHVEHVSKDTLGGGGSGNRPCPQDVLQRRKTDLHRSQTLTFPGWPQNENPAQQWQPVLSSSGTGLFYLPAYPTSVEFAPMGHGDLETHTELCFGIDCIENKHVG